MFIAVINELCESVSILCGVLKLLNLCVLSLIGLKPGILFFSDDSSSTTSVSQRVSDMEMFVW